MSQAENVLEVSPPAFINEFSQKIHESLEEVAKQANCLATEDFASVGRGFAEMMAQKISSQPYETLVTALGIGFGLGALDFSHVKQGVIRVGKLIAMRALSEMDSKNTGDSHATKSTEA